MKKFKNSRLSTDSRKLQTLALNILKIGKKKRKKQKIKTGIFSSLVLQALQGDGEESSFIWPCFSSLVFLVIQILYFLLPALMSLTLRDSLIESNLRYLINHILALLLHNFIPHKWKYYGAFLECWRACARVGQKVKTLINLHST